MTALPATDESLVIFDCDGVLVDSERLIVDAEVRIFEQLGRPIGRDEIIQRFVGTTGEDFRRHIDELLGADGYQRWKVLYDEWFDEHFYGELEVVSGVRESLAAIAQRRCVASNSGPERVRRSLEVTCLDAFFGGRVFTASDVRQGKPAPDVFLHAARAMGTWPSCCVVVEDSAIGVQAARAAGMRVLAYAGGITHREQVAGPLTTVFTDMRDLPELVAQAFQGAATPSPTGDTTSERNLIT